MKILGYFIKNIIIALLTLVIILLALPTAYDVGKCITFKQSLTKTCTCIKSNYGVKHVKNTTINRPTQWVQR